MDVVAEIKDALKKGKLIFGADETLKGVRNDSFLKVFLAKNCPEGLKGDLKKFSGLTGVELMQTELENTDMGDICKKPFAITVIGLLK